MDMNLQKTKKPMTKDEVSLLLDLIHSRPIITSKETNASSNKLKEEAWVSLTNEFNCKHGHFPRHKDQIKSKWDNLKKAARKRSQQVRMNNLKTGGGKPDYIPKDEILQRVTDVLGSTCTGFEVPFGGDGVGCSEEIVLLDGVDVIDDDFSPIQEATIDESVTVFTPEAIGEVNKRKLEESNKLKGLYGIKNFSKELKISKGKKKKMEDGRLERNLAIARYYDAKTTKINLEIEILKEELASKTKKIQASTSCNDA